MERCMLCPRQCGAKREAGQAGVCGATGEVLVTRAAPHLWEEPCLSGTQGAGTVFFAHCPLHCVYCQNRAISGKQPCGKAFSPIALADLFLQLQDQGVHNLDLVTPTHYTPQIIQALTLARQHGLTLPVVYNCSGYECVETLRSLEGLVDIYLPDFKYYSSYYAARYSHAPNYFDIVTEALAEMVRQTGHPIFLEDGLLRRGTLVRHLMLPGLSGDTAQILRFLAEHYSSAVLVSLMRQYTPFGMADKYPELNRTITDAEYQEALSLFQDFGLQGYAQEGDSIGQSFIPDFLTNH